MAFARRMRNSKSILISVTNAAETNRNTCKKLKPGCIINQR